MRLFVLIIGALLAASASAHPTFSTLSEIEFDNGKLEVALRVTRSDLAHEGRPESGAYVRELVSSQLRLVDKSGRVISLRWVGFEVETAFIWAYLEWQVTDGETPLFIENEIFSDTSGPVYHQANLRRGKQRDSLVLTSERSRAALPLFMTRPVAQGR